MNTDNRDAGIVSEIANAIVEQACEDYRAALRGSCEDPDEMMREVTQFFQSEWYKWLTKINPRYLLDRLDAEWRDGKRLIAAGIVVDCPKLKKHYKFLCPLCGGTAETHTKKYKSRKRKDGSRAITYYRVFECACHRPEQIMLRQEVITNENH